MFLVPYIKGSLFYLNKYIFDLVLKFSPIVCLTVPLCHMIKSITKYIDVFLFFSKISSPSRDCCCG